MAYRDNIVWSTIDHLEKLQYETRRNTITVFAARSFLVHRLSALGGGGAHGVDGFIEGIFSSVGGWPSTAVPCRH